MKKSWDSSWGVIDTKQWFLQSTKERLKHKEIRSVISAINLLIGHINLLLQPSESSVSYKVNLLLWRGFLNPGVAVVVLFGFISQYIASTAQGNTLKGLSTHPKSCKLRRISYHTFKKNQCSLALVGIEFSLLVFTNIVQLNISHFHFGWWVTMMFNGAVQCIGWWFIFLFLNFSWTNTLNSSIKHHCNSPTKVERTDI